MFTAQAVISHLSEVRLPKEWEEKKQKDNRLDFSAYQPISIKLVHENVSLFWKKVGYESQSGSKPKKCLLYLFNDIQFVKTFEVIVFCFHV